MTHHWKVALATVAAASRRVAEYVRRNAPYRPSRLPPESAEPDDAIIDLLRRVGSKPLKVRPETKGVEGLDIPRAVAEAEGGEA